MHRRESWSVELVEEIRRRDFGIYTGRTVLAEVRFSRCGKSDVTLPGTSFYDRWAGNPSTQEDPMIYIPLNLDRLRTGVTVLRDLLRFVFIQRLFYRQSLTNFKALQLHDRCKSQWVNCPSYASRSLAAMQPSKSMNCALLPIPS